MQVPQFRGQKLMCFVLLLCLYNPTALQSIIVLNCFSQRQREALTLVLIQGVPKKTKTIEITNNNLIVRI
jgi:hypothetical protein